VTLKDRILARIVADGPISVADFMAEALLDPEAGYYTTRDPFGRAGDFITAPEISQMFGELIGLALVQAWLDQGRPDNATLVELGPGRGTLMRDALRAMQRNAGFSPRIILVEASAALRAVQKDTLSEHEVEWIQQVGDLPRAPLLLVANEIFDALPIRQFQRDGPGWREIRIGADGGDLTRGLGQRQVQPALNHRLDDTRDGDVVELCPGLPTICAEIGARLADHGGAALIIDYGDWRSLGDTLQALRGHRFADPLEHPGAADLTAHVDFEAIARAASPAKATRLTPQGVFLERLGITTRAQALARNLTGGALDSHVAAHRRLTHPGEMGNLFKVMGLYPDTCPPPPGLEP
jgi:NADH dehydrogenase [ubiquinone] 1 alpha subcomplex assembly factor 7